VVGGIKLPPAECNRPCRRCGRGARVETRFPFGVERDKEPISHRQHWNFPENGNMETRKMNRVENNKKVGVKSKRNERGATMVEYAVMVALIAVAIMAAVRFLGSSVSGQMVAVGTQIN
jgi:Flp pilus assembly pilin Flp